MVESEDESSRRVDDVERILRERGPIRLADIAKALKLTQKVVSAALSLLGERQPIASAGTGARKTYQIDPAGSGGGGGGSQATPPGSSDSPSGSNGPGSPSPKARFNPRDLDRGVLSLPLRELLDDLANGRREQAGEKFHLHGKDKISLIIDLNLGYPGGLARARHRVFDLLVAIAAPARDETTSAPAGADAIGAAAGDDVVGAPAPGSTTTQAPSLDALAPLPTREASGQYVFAWLNPDQLRRLLAFDNSRSDSGKAAIYRVWPDNLVRTSAVSMSSLAAIKADAAAATFSCSGEDIVWAVVDSGIDGSHPHFETHANLYGLPPGILHMDFVEPAHPEPLVDGLGHGTHVAGIIAGELKPPKGEKLGASAFESDAQGNARSITLELAHASGVAPKCKLVSYKVVAANNTGPVTGVMAALEEINRVNGYGKLIRIHGVNMSLGYPFEARWFACGHSPLCEVVDRLVKSGVVVVVAAGNNGYGQQQLENGSWGQGLAMSITDPGNADGAITVGSTHRDSPHTFGVSYFSSKGPTGDGRNKPDLLAPGERIISCSAKACREEAEREPGAPKKPRFYREESGTSMAAPHVSGAVAAFLSVRKEFVGKSEAVKQIFLKTALDLGRNNYMQGYGLLDLLRALQSV